MNQQVEPLTEKQWEEIWKYFGFSKKRRMFKDYCNYGNYTRKTVVVDPNNESYGTNYPATTFETIFKWIFPQLIFWSIEKDNKGYLWIKMDLKTQRGRVYSQNYLDGNSDIWEIVQMIGEMLLKMIR